MARRIASIVRGGPAAASASDPALEANVYAVAEDVDLTLVLRGAALELALTAGEVRPGDLAGVPLPPAAGAQDLRGLVESGVRVLACDGDLRRQGLSADDVVSGVDVVDEAVLAQVLRAADGVLTW